VLLFGFGMEGIWVRYDTCVKRVDNATCKLAFVSLNAIDLF